LERPKLNFDIRKRPYPIPIKYNSKGLREFEYDYKKPENVFRILVLGDSYVEDMGSFFANLHTKWLERKLNKLEYSYKFEVINGGHYAFDNDQEYMFYLMEGRKYSPDIVIVMFNGDKARYATLDERGRLTLQYQIFNDKQRLYRKIVSFTRRNTHFGSFVLNRLHKIKRFKDFLVARRYKEKDALIIKHPLKDKDFKKDIDFGSVDFRDVDKAIWTAFKNDVDKDGAAFILFSCMKDYMSDKNMRFLSDNRILLSGMESAVLRKLGKLKGAQVKAGTYNKLYDSHRFGYKANEKVADTILEFMLERRLLPKEL